MQGKSDSMANHEPKPGPRRRRADGEISRTRILNAAAEIAAERGYEGTTIGAVSANCGLPASSIYWHFKDKDDLLAAVIERSFTEWLAAWDIPDTGTAGERTEAVAVQIATALLQSSDFIRLGLMLALERRPIEPKARARFMAGRAHASRSLKKIMRDLSPALTDAQLDELTTYALAGADGLFIAGEIGGDSIDLITLFRLHARMISDAATRMASERLAS